MGLAWSELVGLAWSELVGMGLDWSSELWIGATVDRSCGSVQLWIDACDRSCDQSCGSVLLWIDACDRSCGSVIGAVDR